MLTLLKRLVATDNTTSSQQSPSNRSRNNSTAESIITSIPPFDSSSSDADPTATPPPSEPLSISTALIGLIAASSQTYNDLTDLNVAPAKHTAPLDAASRTLKSFQLTVQVLYKYLRRFELDLLQKPSRPGLVQIDWLVAVLTEGAAVVSELGGKLVELREGAVGGGGGVREVDWAVLCFARREELSDASARLRTTEAIMTKINSVLQVGDELEAMRHKTQSQEAVNSLLQSDGSLAHRMHRLQDVFGSRALVPRERLEAIAALPPPGYSIPAPTNEQLPDYTATDTPSSTQNQSHQDTNDNRGGNNNNDGSTTIRPGGSWSIFSSLTLADISILSLIPLPLESGNVRYSRFYTSSYCRSVNDELGALAESNTKNKAGPLARILGLREVGQKAKDERFARRMGMKYDEENPNRSRPQPPIRSLNL